MAILAFDEVEVDDEIKVDELDVIDEVIDEIQMLLTDVMLLNIEVDDDEDFIIGINDEIDVNEW